MNKTSKTKQKQKKKPKQPTRTYPRITLSEAIKIGNSIKELNGGNPWDPAEIAKAINIGARTNEFYYYASSSRDFGLTKGTSRSDKIELTEFGKELFYAPDPGSEQQKKTEAFLKVPLFKQVLDHYKGTELPDMKYLGNTLEKEFNLVPDFHEEFAKLFRENTKDLGITSGEAIGEEEKTTEAEIPKEKDLTRIVGEPRKKSDKTLVAFVIMPFKEKEEKRSTGFFREVLESLITPSGVEAGFLVQTANIQGSDVIQSTIVNQLINADLVVADLTDHNPNVLFELGIRMATEKPVAIIKSSDTGKIFDVDNMLRVYEYNANLWKSTIEQDQPKIMRHIRATWENRNSDVTYMKLLKGSTVST